MKTLRDLIDERKDRYPQIISHPNFDKRLKWEMIEIEVQDEENYFLDLFEKGTKFINNENNLLVPYLLGIVDVVDLDQEPSYKMGDFPDVDVDYLPIVRDYLKNVWAPEQFGEHNVCSIGNYGTFGLKSSLIDMTRVHGLDRNEILKITTSMGLKDDDGQALTLDKALELYPELKSFCDRHPEVELAVRKLLHRNRSMGKHAGGLIICDNRIDNFVPLVRGTDGNPVSGWVEGLHGQDLGPVGLIKFDLLVVDGLYQVAFATKLVKERHKLKTICALEGDWDWSDTAYLNDPLSITMANKGDMKCIFQFDSEGIRNLVIKGGVSSFDDLVAYVSIYRPSTLQVKMDEEYVQRKKGQKKYEIPNVLQPVLESSYGILIYQEHIMKILNIVGKIPLRDCYQVIKAISKKKLSAFIKYKDKFIENGQKTLGWNQKQMEEYWQLIESFSGYGFNLSHATAYSYISARQLFLKSHYPIEFYTSSLVCQDGDEKKREYITEAINHGVEVCSLDINKSRETFSIVDNKIFIGFSNIKGIGEEKAANIVKLQPYNGFEDFLDRYGTDANVVKPLISLRVFKEASPAVLYKFWLAYSEYRKSIKDKEKRLETNLQALLVDFVSILPDFMRKALQDKQKISAEILQVAIDFVSARNIENKDLVMKNLNALDKKLKGTFTRYSTSISKLGKPSLSNFDDSKIEIDDKKILPFLVDKDAADFAFYGFIWDNPVRKLSTYKPNFNFSNAKYKQNNEPQEFYAVIGQIVDAAKKSFKSGKGSFMNVILMDDNFETSKITFWQEDMERFSEELKVGNLVSIQVVPANNGFPGYTFYAPPKHKRHVLPKQKSLDYRLILL